MLASRWIKRSLLFAALSAGVTPGVARAQLPADMVDRPTAQLVQDAFSTKYGRLLVAELGRILGESANADCVRSSRLDAGPEALERRAREILVRNGTTIVETNARAIDTAKFESVVVAEVGLAARKEYALLLLDPDVKRANQLGEPQRLARLASPVAEIVGRAALVKRMGLVRTLNPYTSEALIAAEEAALGEEEVERFFAARSTPRLERWLKLTDAMTAALRVALDPEKSVRSTDINLIAGQLGEDLAKACVFPRPR